MIGNFPLNWFRESKPAGAYRGGSLSDGNPASTPISQDGRSRRNTLRLITANNSPCMYNRSSIFGAINFRFDGKNEREKRGYQEQIASRSFPSFEADGDSGEANCSSYLSFCGRGNPSNVQEKCGVGLPIAIHLSDTEGPGCIVCSMNLYRS